MLRRGTVMVYDCLQAYGPGIMIIHSEAACEHILWNRLYINVYYYDVTILKKIFFHHEREKVYSLEPYTNPISIW